MDNVEVVAARIGRTQRKWVVESINRHAYHMNELRSEYATLCRLSPRVWASRSVVYGADPLPPDHPEYDRHTEKFILRCFTSANRQYSIADIGDKLVAGNLHPWLKIGASKCIVTATELDDVVRADFNKRMVLLMRDRDPGLLGRNRKEPALSSPLSPLADKVSDTAKRAASHYTARTIQSVDRQVRTIRAQYVALGFVKTLALSVIQLLFKGWRAFAGQMVMGVFQPILDAIKSADAANSRSQDIGISFWDPGRSARTGNQHYCRLDPQQGRLIRLLGYDESDVRPLQGAQMRTKPRRDWAEHYVLGTLSSPAGSVMTRRNLGGMDILSVEQPNGLSVHYLIGKKIAYAVMRRELQQPFAEPLPAPVRRMLERKGPVVKVYKGETGRLHSRAIDPDEFVEAITNDAILGAAVPEKPPCTYDLSLLNEFNKRAHPPPAPLNLGRKMLEKGTTLVEKARDTLGFEKAAAPLPVEVKPQAGERTKAVLDHHLDQRETLAETSITPARRASRKGPGADL